MARLGRRQPNRPIVIRAPLAATGGGQVTRGNTNGVDFTLNENASTASLTCTLPSAMASGKLLVAHVISPSTPGLPGTGGWQWATGTPVGVVFTGFAYTTDPAAGLVFTQAIAGRITVILTVYSGADSATVLDVTPTTNDVATQSMTLTGVTTVTDGDMLVSGCGIDASTITTITQPAGWNLVARNTSGVGKGGAYADLGQATAGATGNKVWTNDAAAGLRQSGYLAAIKAAPGGGGATPITLPESGTGADALTVTAAVPLVESGTGADALTVTAAVPLVETGVATDTLTVDQGATPKTLPEQGTATDTLSVTAAIGLGETAAGSDTLTVGVAVPLAETGTATDALTVEQAATPKTLAETGSGADSLTVAVAVTLPESTGATDTLTAAAAVPLAQPGAGADSLSVVQGDVKTLADTGAGAEALAVTATGPLAETGGGADTLAISQTRTLTDTGTSSQSLTVEQARTLADTGTATDTLLVTVAANLADLATAADQSAATVLLTLAETAAGADAFVVSEVPVYVPGRGASTVHAGSTGGIRVEQQATGTSALAAASTGGVLIE